MSNSNPGQPENSARRLAVAAVLVGALIGSLITWIGQDFEQRLVFDTWQRADAREVMDDEVVVVMIDDNSVDKVGQWPWVRLNVAVLLDRIATAEPAAIGIDIYFTEEDAIRPEAFADIYEGRELDEETAARIRELPSMDLALAGIIARPSSPTVMARAASREKGTDAGSLTYDFIEGEPPSQTERYDRVIASIPALEDEAYSHAFVNGSPDSDGVVRRVPLSIWSGDSLESGFAVELARIKKGAEFLAWDGDRLNLADLTIPSDSRADLLFKMGPAQPYYSAVDLLSDEFPLEKLSGKVVILGVGATGTGDIVATPHGNEVLGALVQAQAVDAILKRDWLSYPDWSKALEIVFTLALFALILACAVSAWNWLLLPAGAIAIALPIGSYLAYAQANLLFDPARPLIIALFAALGLLLARYATALQELVAQRIREAEQKKENENARDLQLRMVPSPERLAELGRRTEIGAKLRPAKSVGGDFYDAFELEDDRLLFLVGDVSGKGLGAALFMAFSKTAAKSKFLSHGTRLDDAVIALNDELSREEDDAMDLTLLAGLIDCTSGKVELVNAGHENPLRVYRNGKVEMVDLRGGPRLRSFDGFPYQIEEVLLDEGDTLVLISDGATDAENIQRVQFGFEGVIRALEEQSDVTANARVEFLADRIAEFEGDADPADDLTIFALRYVGEGYAPSPE
ncbi:CHASE2 domain-containing protein [Erythrobacter sp. KY5]|uniref:CHASE2 domain-containing protein n=1 Tax=Erythrobacter sp. KY5 TaxID=2011159 RepID=UPI0013A6C716|nr:CHASE2 domain-containing protein [Erythrobacter sp. KY5]